MRERNETVACGIPTPDAAIRFAAKIEGAARAALDYRCLLAALLTAAPRPPHYVGLMMPRALMSSAVAVCLWLASGVPLAARDPTFSRLVIFGDSLSDTGNAGRYSDGLVWVEFVARRIGVEARPSRDGGTNYAVGGALTHGGRNDIRGQLHAYLRAAGGRGGGLDARVLDSRALFIVYGGANDLLASGCAPDRAIVADNAANALRATLDDLAAAGARHILVANLPDLGLAPVVRSHGQVCAAEARRLTMRFNQELEVGIAAVEAKWSIAISRIDVFALTDALIADPTAAGFRDVDTPCLPGPCNGELFWDYLHPTARGHARLALAALDAIGLPADE
jgi:cholinesterase